MVHIPVIDWSKYPLQPGIPSRVPSDGWSNWFKCSLADFDEALRLGEEDYLDEWRECGEAGLKDIAEAAKRAGISDINARLNEAVGMVGARVVSKLPSHVYILDIGGGSGNTSLAVYGSLFPEDRKKVSFTTIDLSKKMLEGGNGEKGYIQKLRGAGAVVDDAIVGSDLEFLPQLDKDKYGLIVGVASLHQHGYLKWPFREIYRVASELGYFVTGDWHVYSMWKHPALVRKMMLERAGFDGREELLEQFDAAYPLAKEEPGKGTEVEERSNLEIANFWLHYANVIREGEPRPRFRFLEGHRPAEDYKSLMSRTGFRTYGADIVGGLVVSNPFYLRPDSTLNAVTVGRKWELDGSGD